MVVGGKLAFIADLAASLLIFFRARVGRVGLAKRGNVLSMSHLSIENIIEIPPQMR